MIFFLILKILKASKPQIFFMFRKIHRTYRTLARNMVEWKRRRKENKSTKSQTRPGPDTKNRASVVNESSGAFP